MVLTLGKVCWTIFLLNVSITYTMEKQIISKNPPRKAALVEFKDLKQLCAENILHYQMKLDENYPIDLHEYIFYVKKLNILKNEHIAPFFQHYLLKCLPYLSLKDLQNIAELLFEANKISKSKCLLIQIMLSLYPTIFLQIML